MIAVTAFVSRGQDTGPRDVPARAARSSGSRGESAVMAGSEIVRLALDVAAVERVAHLLGTPARLEPYTVRSAPVFRLSVRNHALGAEVALILWPSLAR